MLSNKLDFKELTERINKVKDKPIRKAKTTHMCFVCNKPITFDEEYFDGGRTFRMHKVCEEYF